MGVGGWAKAAHQLPLDQLLREPGERDRLAGELAEYALTLSCVNAAGNPLHPDPAVGPRHAAKLRGAIELAALLGVERVVTMSGCPGGRDGGPSPVFAPWALVPDDEPVRINFDPSHFWWQGIDPLRVIDQLGDRIGFCHGKDTLLHGDRIALD